MGSNVRKFWSRLRALFRRSSDEAEFQEELQTHIALLAERFERQSMTAEEARYAARRQFGGITQMKENLRERRGFPLLDSVLQDLRYISRQLRKSPVFTASAILTLALGIGANTAIFSLVDQLILQLLPVKDPQQIVELAAEGHDHSAQYGRNMFSYPMYEDLRDHNQVFSQMLCRRAADFTISTASGSEVVSGELVSGNYFGMLGLHAALGRLFTASDTLHENTNPIAVLSYAYWKDQFGGNRNVIGLTIRVNSYPLTIVGVAQPGFNGLEPGLPAEVFVPVTMTPAIFSDREYAQIHDRRIRWLNVYGRLKPGFTEQMAKAGMQPLFHQILDIEVRQAAFLHVSADDKKQFLRMWLNVLPGSQGSAELRQVFEQPLWILTGIVGLILLIACANLASLLMARASVRQREISIRLAIGASRFRIMRQLFTESIALAILGGALGIGVAVWMLKGLLSFLPPNVGGYSLSSSPDLGVLSFSIAVSLLTGLLFGMAPALQATKPELAKTLKEQGTIFAYNAGQVNLSKVLVSAQIALSLLLLIGAGLFIHTLVNLRSLNPGFRVRNLAQLQVGSLHEIGYSGTRTQVFYRNLEERLYALPGVRSVGVASAAVLSDNGWANEITIAGYQPKPGEDMTSYHNAVRPGFFRTLGMHFLAGRDFTASDQSGEVAIVNERFACQYFADCHAMGHYIGLGADPGTKTNIEIIGVVNDAYYSNLHQVIPKQVYLCGNQYYIDGSTVYIRTDKDPRSLFSSIRAVVRDIDPKVPILSIKTVQKQIDESLLVQRMIATLSTGFGILATLLAVVGLYGTMSYMVARRAREIAIRMALGAVQSSVVWLVMREVLLLVAAGIAIALPLAFLLTRFVQAELYGIGSNDPAAITGATAMLAAISLLAGYIPARRAAAYDPMTVLRYE